MHTQLYLMWEYIYAHALEYAYSCSPFPCPSTLIARNVISIPHPWQCRRRMTALPGALQHADPKIMCDLGVFARDKRSCVALVADDKSCARSRRSIWACRSWQPWQHPKCQCRRHTRLCTQEPFLRSWAPAPAPAPAPQQRVRTAPFHPPSALHALGTLQPSALHPALGTLQACLLFAWCLQTPAHVCPQRLVTVARQPTWDISRGYPERTWISGGHCL